MASLSTVTSFDFLRTIVGRIKGGRPKELAELFSSGINGSHEKLYTPRKTDASSVVLKEIKKTYNVAWFFHKRMLFEENLYLAIDTDCELCEFKDSSASI